MNTNNKVNKGDFKYYTSKSRPSLTIRIFVPKTEKLSKVPASDTPSIAGQK